MLNNRLRSIHEILTLMSSFLRNQNKPFSISYSHSSLAGVLGLVFFFVLSGCDTEPTPPAPPSPIISSSVESAPSLSSSTATQDYPRIVAFGNSLTAGLGVAPDQSYPAQLQKRLDEAGHHYLVINAGVSGDTTAGGLRRLNWALKSQPSIVIVELGVNDAMRGQPIASMYSNLDGIITKFREVGTVVVLAGMKIPPNYGLDYTIGFSSMFEKLAQKHEITLIPFLLEGVAAKPELNQADGIHPTAPGYQIVTDTVMEALTPLLEEVGPL
jgi:acyl-CoA thioesterase-1